MSALLEVKRLEVSYAGVPAVRGLSFEVNKGEAVSYTHLTLPTTPYV